MKNPRLTLKDRIVIRLVTTPKCLAMGEFSVVSEGCETTFCLAGLILDESGVFMEYNPDGIAVGLEAGEQLPDSRWIDHETSLSASPVAPERVMIAAKARELWAANHGEVSAMLLPFYGPEWGLNNDEVNQVTAEQMIELLQVINIVADRESVTP